MRNIFIKNEYLSLILKRQKNQTIRKWKTCSLVSGEKILFNFKYPAEIIKIEKKKIGELTDIEITQDGFQSRQELIENLMRIYGEINNDDSIYIINFKLL